MWGAARDLLEFLRKAPGTLLVVSSLLFLALYALVPQAFPLTRGQAGLVAFWLLSVGVGFQLISLLAEERRKRVSGGG